MKQLTGLDASFLYLETPTTYGHVNGLGIFERPHAGFDPYPAVRAKWASLVGVLEPMRRRLVEVPLGLDHPYWIDDPNFDLDFHVRQLNLARPGRPDQLADQVARIVGRPMDRSRPLWEIYVIDGLEDGCWAMLSKYHHSTIDGAAGVMMLNMITDAVPDAGPPAPSPPWEPEEIPSSGALLRRTAVHLALNPVKAVRVQMRLVQQAAAAAGITSVSAAAGQAAATVKRLAERAQPADDAEPRVALPTTAAPPTPWNKSTTPHRRFAMRSASLEDIKRLKDATGGTVNDVVMAICAGALREYLLRHDVLPDRPLRAVVPVSIRTGDEPDPWTNRVSAIVADLPTDCADPLERVARCREAMLAAKKQGDLVPATAMADMAQFASPALATAAMRVAWRLRLADRMAPPANLVISNVPGPRKPLYFAGARMRNYYPVSSVGDGMGLNITVHSYLDRLDFGLIADRELVPDLWELVDLHIDEITRLFEATGAPRSAPLGATGREGVPAPSARKPEPVKKAAAAKKKAAAKRAPAARKKAAAKKRAPAATKKTPATRGGTKKAAAEQAAPPSGAT